MPKFFRISRALSDGLAADLCVMNPDMEG